MIFPLRKIMRIHSLQQLGVAIRDARKRQALRQDELAAVAGVGIRFLVEVEAGKPTAQIGKVFDVLAALGLEIDITPRGGP